MLDSMEKKKKMVKPKNVRQLIVNYLGSDAYRKLGSASQRDYYDCLMVIHDDLGSTSIKRLGVPLMQEHYNDWLKRGISRANKIASIMSILLNWAIKKEVRVFNPMPHLDKIPNPPRKVKWKPEQVSKFLSTAYYVDNYKWRSIGLIIQMAYEWGQRVGDMRMLTWDTIDFDKGRCDLTQSKKGTDVHLPISGALMHVLKQQKEAFDFQPYIAPQINPSDGAYKPYPKERIHVYVNEILDAAGLPRKLTAMDLRRTAITEMVEAGVDITQIKQVSGHTNINSLTPYIMHTYTGASEALAQRTAFTEEKEIPSADPYRAAYYREDEWL